MPWHHVLGLAAGVVLLALGLATLRFLVRRRVPWWPSVALPLLLWGPALGVLLGSAAGGGAILFGHGEERWPVNVAWSLFLFLGATSLFGLVRAFLRSRVVEEAGLRVPALVLDGLRYLLWIVMAFVVVGGVWGRTEWFTALFTASAIGTVILGLALQETLASFFAGMALFSEGTIAIGDWVVVGDVEGEVVALTRRTTKLRTRTSDLVTLPNRLVATSPLRNLSRPSLVHAERIVVSAAYDAPPNRVRAVLRRAVRHVDGVLQAPAPLFRVLRHADSGVEYELKVYLADPAAIPDVRSDVLAQVWYHFRREGIEIPYPVREVRRRSRGAASAELPLVERLARAPFLAAMPPQALEAMAVDASVHEVGSGERLVEEGDAGEACWLLESGRAAVLVGRGEAERQVAVLEPGAVFGEMSLLTGEPRSATVRTMEDSRLVRIGGAGLRRAMEAAPDLAMRLAEVAALRREGLLDARGRLSAAQRALVAAGTRRLVPLIRAFFRLPEAGATRDGPGG